MGKIKFDIQLTEHFKLSEFFVTNQNYNDVDVIDSSVYHHFYSLSVILEELRSRLGIPIIITSGFRSEKLNDIVQGADKSFHKVGCAVDFTFKFDKNYTDNYNKAASILESLFDEFQRYDDTYDIAELFGSRSCRFFHIAINVHPFVNARFKEKNNDNYREYKHIKDLNYYE